VGCMMRSHDESTYNDEFKENALEIIFLFEVGIEFIGFPQSELQRLNDFYEIKCTQKEEEVKKRIMNIHYDFFGGANFKDRDDPQNKQLSNYLLKELSEIKNTLR